MKRTIQCGAWMLAIGFLASVGANVGLAQVETLNPNPLETQGVGSGFGPYRSGAEGTGNGLRSSGPGDNPAGTMLRELNRPEYYQGRGRVRITGPALEASRRAYRLSHQRQQLLEGAVYFADRGSYEDAIYRPRRGSYRYETRTLRTSNYRSGN